MYKIKTQITIKQKKNSKNLIPSHVFSIFSQKKKKKGKKFSPIFHACMRFPYIVYEKLNFFYMPKKYSIKWKKFFRKKNIIIIKKKKLCEKFLYFILTVSGR